MEQLQRSYIPPKNSRNSETNLTDFMFERRCFSSCKRICHVPENYEFIEWKVVIEAIERVFGNRKEWVRKNIVSKQLLKADCQLGF